MYRFTYFLIVLVVSTLAATIVRSTSSTPSAGIKQAPQKTNRFEEAKQHFPTAEYNEADLPDAAKNAAKKEKQKRHNNFKFVAKTPQPWQQETVFIPEGNFDFPALPVKNSELIVVGKVGDASAHLSEGKMNIYSEFSVVISKVLKAPNKEITENSSLTVERLGGYVKYPNGQKVLFRIMGWNMPIVGNEYLFFLNSKNKLDWEIVTAYELTGIGALPLDEASQFEALKGTSPTDILNQVRALVSEQASK